MTRLQSQLRTKRSNNSLDSQFALWFQLDLVHRTVWHRQVHLSKKLLFTSTWRFIKPFLFVAPTIEERTTIIFVSDTCRVWLGLYRITGRENARTVIEALIELPFFPRCYSKMNLRVIHVTVLICLTSSSIFASNSWQDFDTNDIYSVYDTTSCEFLFTVECKKYCRRIEKIPMNRSFSGSTQG